MHILNLSLLSALLIAPASAQGNAFDPVREIVAKHEAVFDAPSAPRPVQGGSRAVSAPLMGNGDVGVCLTGNPDSLSFWVAKNDFWILKNGACAPLCLGILNLKAPALIGAGYATRQSLASGTTVTTLTGKKSKVTMTSFVAATSNVFVVTLACDGEPVDFTASFIPTRRAPANETPRAEEIADGVRFLTRTVDKGVAMPTEATAAWKVSGADAPAFTLAPGKPVTLLVTASAVSGDEVGSGKTRAKATSLIDDADTASLTKAHTAWWRAFWEKSFVEIPDAAIMHRYLLSQYGMACASRDPKFPPAIIGPWITASSGWCGYWMNYNHAAPYYGLYSSNHIEQADPQDAPILDFMPTGEKYAQEIFGGKMRGILYSVGIGPFGFDACGLGQPTQNDHRFEHGYTTWGQRSNAAYNVVNMGRRWYATYDKDYGKKILPYATAVTDFWEDYLTKEDDGKGGYRYVILDDSVQEGTGNNRNPINSLGLLRYTLHLMLDLSKELGVNADRQAKWNDILTHLAPYPTAKAGKPAKDIFVLADNPARLWQNNTVHIQHIYPADGVSLGSKPELLQIARDTIAASPRWHDGNGANSFFPAAVRVGYDPAVILRELHRYSTEFSWPNGFSKGNIHGIENFSTVPNTVNEMLLQSHEGVLRFFPVWPKDKDARFGTLRARGAFLVSAELKSGVVSGVTILSEKGRDCVVVTPWPGKKVSVTRNGVSDKTEIVSGERFTLKTKENETLELNPL